MKKYFINVKGKIIIYSIFMLLGSGIGIIIPIINANLLTEITKFNIKAALMMAFSLFLITIFRAVISRFDVKIYMKIRESILYNIRIDMLKQIFKMKASNFDKTPSGEFQERIKSDPNAINNVFNIVQYSLFSMIKELAMLIYVFILNIYIGLIFVIGLIIIYIYEKIAFKKYAEINKKIMKTADQNGTILNEILKGIKDIRLLNITNKFTNLAGKSLEYRTKQETESRLLSNSIRNTTDVMEAIITFSVIAMGIFLINSKILTLTSFLIIFMYRNDIFGFVLSLTSFKEYLIDYKVAKERIDEIFDEKKYPIEAFGSKTIKNPKGEIKLKNITFGYAKKEIIKGLSLNINSKENIAIVGKSGSGKSTKYFV